jgi:autotransporter passenger strand-loop-strand repeat protein
MISGGGEQLISNDAAANYTTIGSGGTQLVEAGRNANATTIYTGGLEMASGSDTAALISGGEQDVYGVTSGATAFDGLQIVESGGTGSGTIVSAGGIEDVASGGSDVGAGINGGVETVLAGGVASGDTVFTGSQVVSSGGVTVQATVDGGEQDVYGVASDTMVLAGSQIVESGGTAINTTVDSGGTVVLESGAVVSGGIAFAGNGTVEILGSAMPAAAISGFTFGDFVDLASIALASSGGKVVLTSGNVLDVTEGGSTYALHLDPSQNYSGAQFLLLADNRGGTEVMVVSAVVSSSHTLTVSSGQTSNSVLVLKGGALDIRSGGTVIGVIIDSGGTDRVSGRDVGVMLDGGVEVVSRTGVTSGTTILSGGSQADLGVTVATVVSSGTETVSSGGTASNTIVSRGGTLTVLNHGVADPATIHLGGSETVSSGGTDLGALISGGTQLVSGFASGVTVFAGSQVILRGGIASGTTVSGGAEIVSSGAPASLRP